MPVGRDAGRVAEGPLQLQPRYLGSGQAGGACRLESGIRQVHAPPVPRGAPSRIRQTRIAATSIRHPLRVALSCATQRPAAHEFCNSALLRIVQILSLCLHQARDERVVDLLRRHFANRRRRRGAFDSRVAVTDRTSGLERGEPAFRSRHTSALPACLRGWLRYRHCRCRRRRLSPGLRTHRRQNGDRAADHDCQKMRRSSHVGAPSLPVLTLSERPTRCPQPMRGPAPYEAGGDIL